MKRSWTIKANNLYIYRVLISHRLECHCCHVGISKYLYFPPIQFSGPNILSLSFDPNHQFRGACANKSTSAPGPVSAPRVPWTHWHIPPGSPPLGAVSVLFLARRVRPLQTSSVVNIDQLLAEAAHDPRELCPDMRDGITVTHYITETDYLTTAKSFVFPSPLTRSTKPTQSTVSPLPRFVLAVSEINDVFPFNCGAPGCCDLITKYWGPPSGAELSRAWQ